MKKVTILTSIVVVFVLGIISIHSCSNSFNPYGKYNGTNGTNMGVLDINKDGYWNVVWYDEGGLQTVSGIYHTGDKKLFGQGIVYIPGIGYQNSGYTEFGEFLGNDIRSGGWLFNKILDHNVSHEVEDSNIEIDGQIFNIVLLNDLITTYCNYASHNSNEPMAPEYLFEAIDILMHINEPQRAIPIIDQMIVDYPDYPRTQAALFVKGFIYESQYKNLDMAKQVYEQYMTMYPNGIFVDDCRNAIKLMGVSTEDYLKCE